MRWVDVLVVVTAFAMMGGLYLFVMRSKVGHRDPGRLRGQGDGGPDGHRRQPRHRAHVRHRRRHGRCGRRAVRPDRSARSSSRWACVPGIKAFTAAVLGGIGNVPGAMLGGLFLGLIEAIGPTLFLTGFGVPSRDPARRTSSRSRCSCSSSSSGRRASSVSASRGAGREHRRTGAGRAGLVARRRLAAAGPCCNGASWAASSPSTCAWSASCRSSPSAPLIVGVLVHRTGVPARDLRRDRLPRRPRPGGDVPDPGRRRRRARRHDHRGVPDRSRPRRLRRGPARRLPECLAGAVRPADERHGHVGGLVADRRRSDHRRRSAGSSSVLPAGRQDADPVGPRLAHLLRPVRRPAAHPDARHAARRCGPVPVRVGRPDRRRRDHRVLRERVHRRLRPQRQAATAGQRAAADPRRAPGDATAHPAARHRAAVPAGDGLVLRPGHRHRRPLHPAGTRA